jgi:transposase-like protein
MWAVVTDMNLALIGNTFLRAAIQSNLVSFPSQIPAFTKGGDEERRIVQLYFVCGWRTKAICDRYGLSKSALRKMLSEWRIRAVAAGYIQDVHPDLLAALATVDDADRREFEESTLGSDFATLESASAPGPAHLPARVVSSEVHL